MKTIWKVLDPRNPGKTLCLISNSGVIQDHIELDEGSFSEKETSAQRKARHQRRLNTLNCIVYQIKRGVATEAARNLVCVPVDHPHPKRRDSKLLHQIVVNNHKGNTANLRDLPSEIRYPGKINWKDSKVQEQIRHLHAAGKSIRAIAKELEVTPQALTHANKQHGLYPSRQSPIQTKDPKA